MAILWYNLRSYLVLFVGLVVSLCFLDSKYVEYGECASIVYYTPMTLADKITIVGIGIITSAIFFLLSRDKNPTLRKIVIAIYMLIVFGMTIWGNTILGMIEIDWPTKYHPTLL